MYIDQHYQLNVALNLLMFLRNERHRFGLYDEEDQDWHLMQGMHHYARHHY